MKENIFQGVPNTKQGTQALLKSRYMDKHIHTYINTNVHTYTHIYTDHCNNVRDLKGPFNS